MPCFTVSILKKPSTNVQANLCRPAVDRVECAGVLSTIVPEPFMSGNAAQRNGVDTPGKDRNADVERSLMLEVAGVRERPSGDVCGVMQCLSRLKRGIDCLLPGVSANRVILRPVFHSVTKKNPVEALA